MKRNRSIRHFTETAATVVNAQTLAASVALEPIATAAPASVAPAVMAPAVAPGVAPAVAPVATGAFRPI